jgi:TMEM175 potassium channel family protein
MKNSDTTIWMTTQRVETLVDGIFAISMTLLIFSIGIPKSLGFTSVAILQHYIFSLWPNFLAYGLSFFLLGTFWRINHQQFYRIKRTNTTFLWITILYLMFVALIPFSASLVGEYGDYQIAQIFFDLNLFVIGVLTFLTWYYASNNNLLDENMLPDSISRTRRNNLILPIISLIAIGLTFISPSYSPLVYLSIIFITRFN